MKNRSAVIFFFSVSLASATVSAADSPTLVVEYVGPRGDDVIYTYRVDGGNDDLRYWLVVENRGGEYWLQGGGEIGKLLKHGVSKKLVIEDNGLLFPARIFIAGFGKEDFEHLREETRKDNPNWDLPNHSLIVDSSYPCQTDEKGLIVSCGRQ